MAVTDVEEDGFLPDIAVHAGDQYLLCGFPIDWRRRRFLRPPQIKRSSFRRRMRRGGVFLKARRRSAVLADGQRITRRRRVGSLSSD